MTHTDTPQQTAFIDELLNTSNHIALVARAGTGKTTTILRGVEEYLKKNPRADVVVCAYNKSIADEVSAKLKKQGQRTEWTEQNGRRVPPSVTAATLHSMGFGLLRTVYKDVKIDENKVRNIVALRNEPICKSYSSQICQLVAYAKNAAVGFFNDLPISNVQVWFDLADHYDINGVDDMQEMEEIVAAAQRVYVASLEQVDVIDFDDMILFPLIKNIRVKWGKDLIFLDEAQDLSRARQALARKFIRYPNGRMVIVGDDRQAIYGFSGADASALNNLIDGLGAVRMPLTVTWRCPVRIVNLAQTLVPDIQCATERQGSIQDLSMHAALVDFEWLATDAILCRNTAPLISMAYGLIRKGVPCRVEGRAIGEGLDKMVTRWKVKSIDALLNRLQQYREREVQKALAKGSEAKAEEVNDKCDTLKEICGAVLAKGGSTVEEVRQFISTLFADGVEGVLTLATYHRSKGREWDRVFLLDHYNRCPSRAARQHWQRVQEENLAYVAFTRTKNELYFVQED